MSDTPKKCHTNNYKFYVLLAVHLNNLSNENQLDELVILNLFRHSTSTRFGRIYCPSSVGIHCICTPIGTCYMFRWLAASWVRIELL
jgi:hypothetical protein